MGKILKYCNTCDEGFADKFQFCPTCGDSLQAFEMKPVTAEPAVPTKKAEPKAPATREVSAAPPPAPSFIEAPREIEPPPPVEAAPVARQIPAIEAAPPQEAEIAREEPIAEKPAVEKKAVPAVAAAAPVLYQTPPMQADGKSQSLEEAHSKAQREGGYYLTVIEEKNSGTRNGLLLGAAAFMSVVLLSGLVINIFSKDLEIGSIDDTMFNAVMVDDVPTATEDKPQPKKDKNAGGGGGGGQKQDETTQGDLANQTKNPQRPPEAMPRLENPSLVLPPASTQGNKTFDQTHDRYGDPNGRFTNFNNGSGSGGGQGTGTGTGQGSGRGTGAGSGIGSGYGGGIGNGNGSGTGDGTDGNDPPRPKGESVPFRITSKPRAAFTNEARQAQFTGTVLLKVTFLANGSIGGVSAIKGAPYGLTESAISAAKGIRFEPAKVNGVPTTVTKSVEYSFTLY